MGVRAAGDAPGQAEPGADHNRQKAVCTRHECRPMAASTIRRIHDTITAAFGFAAQEGWADRSPADLASPPRLNATGIEPPDVA